MQNYTKWRERYIELAAHISEWSKDPSRKIGAVVVGSKGEILSQGFNGFPRGIEDTQDRLNTREEKYKYVVHAEMNAIYNACLNGVSLENAEMYVHGLPVCAECAKGIIQTGVKRVVMHVNEEIPEQWIASWNLTKQMLEEAGVKYELWIQTEDVSTSIQG